MNRKQHIEYAESQSFGQWWIWALMTALNLVFASGIVWQVFMGNRFGSDPMPDAGLIAVSCIILIFSIIVGSSKLKTYINNDGVYVRYFPFAIKTCFFSWDEIEKAYVREYNALREYGGFGVRRKLFTTNLAGLKTTLRNMAFIVSGKHGVQLELKNGRKVLIGTRNPDKLSEIIRQLAQ